MIATPARVVVQSKSLERQDRSDCSNIPDSFQTCGLSGPAISSPATLETDNSHSNVQNAQTPVRKSQRSSPVNDSAAVIPSSASLPLDDVQVPPAKRRRVEQVPQTSLSIGGPRPEATANVPIPSMELDNVSGVVSKGAEVGNSLVGIARIKKPRLSAQATRKKQIQTEAAEVVANIAEKAPAKSKKPRKNAKGKDAQRPDSGISGGYASPPTEASAQIEQAASTARPKRKTTKRKRSKNVQDAAAEIVEDAINGSSTTPKRRGRKSKREVTPDGADAVVISPLTMKMSDLCKDSRTGRKSQREKDLQDIEQAESVRKQLKEQEKAMGQSNSQNSAEPRRAEREESVANNVPSTKLVDGRIQIDEDSLQIDRHAAAAAERDAEQLDAIDETDLTRKVNSFSWLKRDKSGGWNELLTERFYEGLRMFGTDFEMISKMFPGRTRHKIKLKFVKEERINLDKIKAALLGEKLPVDLPEFEKMAGFEVDDPKELEMEMQEDRKRLEEETLAEKQALDDIRNEREAQIAAERAAAGEESSAKENQKCKKRRKKGEKHKGDKDNDLTPKVKRAKKADATGGIDTLG